MRWVTLFCVFAFPLAVWAAPPMLFSSGRLATGGQTPVVHDASASAGTTTAGTSLTISSFTSACTDCYTIVGLCIRGGAAHNPSCTYNAVTLNDLTDSNTTESANIYFFGEKAIATGTADVQCTWTGSLNAAMTVISLGNVNQTTPAGTPANTSVDITTSVSVNVAGTTAPNNIVVDTACSLSQDASLSVGGGQTERTQAKSTGANVHAATSTEPAGGTVAMSWSWVTAGADVSTVGVEINAK